MEAGDPGRRFNPPVHIVSNFNVIMFTWSVGWSYEVKVSCIMIQLTLTLKMTTAQVVETGNVSPCQQQQSYSGLRSPGRSNSSYFWNDSWVQTFHNRCFCYFPAATYGVSIQSFINLDKTFFRIPHISNILRTWLPDFLSVNGLHFYFS